MIEGSSDKVWDAWIAKSFSRNLFSLAFIVFLRSASLCAANVSGKHDSERVAIADTRCLFAADTRRSETIAAGSSDQRLRLQAGRTSIE